MTREEMFKERSWLEGLLKAAGCNVYAMGMDEREDVAELSFTKDTQAFNVRLSFKGEQQG